MNHPTLPSFSFQVHPGPEASTQDPGGVGAWKIPFVSDEEWSVTEIQVGFKSFHAAQRTHQRVLTVLMCAGDEERIFHACTGELVFNAFSEQSLFRTWLESSEEPEHGPRWAIMCDLLEHVFLQDFLISNYFIHHIDSPGASDLIEAIVRGYGIRKIDEIGEERALNESDILNIGQTCFAQLMGWLAVHQQDLIGMKNDIDSAQCEEVETTLVDLLHETHREQIEDRIDCLKKEINALDLSIAKRENHSIAMDLIIAAMRLDEQREEPEDDESDLVDDAEESSAEDFHAEIIDVANRLLLFSTLSRRERLAIVGFMDSLKSDPDLRLY